MNRKERRRMQREANREGRRRVKKAQSLGGEWGEWEDCSQRVKEDDPRRPDGLQAAFLNDMFSVQVYFFDDGNGNTLTCLGVRRNDSSPDITWSDLHRIKNEICGEGRWAAEMFPPVKHTVDLANMRWLWVGPKHTAMPFGFHLEKLYEPKSTKGQIIHADNIELPPQA